MEKLCIYHKGCADGQGAAAAMYLAYPDTEFYPGVYSEAPPDVTGRDVYLVDFSYPLEVLQDMLETAAAITIIDHHKTAIDALKGFEHPRLFKYLDNNHSGAALTWLHFFPSTALPQMLVYIEDRDLWRQPPMADTKAITAYLYSLDFDVHKWSKWLNAEDFEAKFPYMQTAGQALVRQDQHRVRTLVENAHQAFIGGHHVRAVNTNHFHASDVGHELAKLRKFAATYYFDGTMWSFSLRSSKEGGEDVSEIAKQYGGGGHKNAAGFRLTPQQLAEHGIFV